MDIVIIVILEIGLIAAFISLFYFLYVVKVEDDIIKKQAVKITKNIIRDLEFFSPKYAQQVRDEIKKIDVSTVKSDNELIEEKNKKLLKQTIITVVVLLVICLALATGFYVWKGGNISKILFSTFCALVVVAMVEFLFLTFIIENYETIDPNVIKLAVFQGLEKWFLLSDGTLDPAELLENLKRRGSDGEDLDGYKRAEVKEWDLFDQLNKYINP